MQTAVLGAANISTHSLTRRLTFYNIDTDTAFYISTHSLTRRLTIPSPWSSPGIQYFNSQPHKEADICCYSLSSYICISTHSLTRRLTCCHLYLFLLIFISTHSLTRRLTHSRLHTSIYHPYFNSQPHKEADYVAMHDDTVNKAFQLTASQGGWRYQYNNLAKLIKFQLTASQGGWQPTPICLQMNHRNFNSQPHKEADS